MHSRNREESPPLALEGPKSPSALLAQASHPQARKLVLPLPSETSERTHAGPFCEYEPDSLTVATSDRRPNDRWEDYRDLLRTVMLCATLFCGVVTYEFVSARHESAKDQVFAKPSNDQDAPNSAPGGTMAAVGLNEIDNRPHPASLVSILSTPPGALIEIEGVVYGQTPLIMPSPAGRTELKVKLHLDQYQGFEKIVTPNEAGHFTVNTVLKRIP